MSSAIVSNNLFNHNIERAVLSTAIFEPVKFEEIAVQLKPEDFYHPFHQNLFTAMEELYKSDQPIDEEFLKEKLIKKNQFDEAAFLDVIAYTNPLANVYVYAKEIKQKAKYKQAILQKIKELINNSATIIPLHHTNKPNAEMSKYEQVYVGSSAWREDIDNMFLLVGEKEDIQPFTAEEVERILKVAPIPLKNYLAIGFYTGMRSGEILGLQVSDIDFASNIISVRRSISKGIISTPKTKNSVRDVPLFNVLKPYIESQIHLARKDRSLFLFSKNGEHLYSVDSIRGKKPYGAWYKLLKELNIPYRKIYNTRHTFITAMLKTGQLSVLEIAQIVGHTNSKMIFKNYARFIRGEHLKISSNFDPFGRGDTLGDTYRFNVS